MGFCGIHLGEIYQAAILDTCIFFFLMGNFVFNLITIQACSKG